MYLPCHCCKFGLSLFGTDKRLYHYILVRDKREWDLCCYFYTTIILIIRHESLNAIRITCTRESALTPTPSPTCLFPKRPPQSLLQAKLPAGPVTDGNS